MEKERTYEELEAALQDLKEKECDFKSTLENLPVGVVVHAADTSILLSNSKAHEILGYTKEQIEGKKITSLKWNFLNPDKSIMQIEDYPVYKVINTKKPLYDYTLGISKPNRKETTWVSVVATPELDENEKITKVIINFIDITEKNNAQNKLLKSEKELNKVQEITHTGSWYLDVETNEVTWTEELYKMYGFDSTLPPPPYTEHMKLFTPESWDILSKSLDKTRRTGIPYELTLNTVREDGSNGWMWVRGEAVFDQNNKITGLWGAAQDITKHKLVEMELSKAKQRAEESEIKYKAAFYTSPDSVNINKLSGEYVDVNEGFTRLTGYTKEEVFGNLSTDINIWAFPEDREKLILELKKNGIVENLESVFKTKNGKLIPALMSAKIISLNGQKHILSVTREISERKKFEKKLQRQNEEYATLNEEYKTTNEGLIKAVRDAEESKNRLKTFINSIPDIICYKDGKGRWLLANDADLELFSLTNVDYYGKTDLELADDTAPIYKDAFKTCMISDEKTWANKKISHGIEIIPTIKGEAKIYDVFKIPIFHPNGQRKALAVIGRDITELQETQNKLSEALKKAEESNLLKTEFIHNMSHEIRTPMNGILGFSDILSKPNLTETKKRQYINIIQNSGNQLMRIIDNILEISRLGTKQVIIKEKQLCLNDLLLELFSIFDIKAKENKTPLYLKKGLSDKNSTILTDRAKLNTILSNLLENSLKFTNDGFIEIGYTLKKNELEIYVKDTGVGIKKEHQKTIFDRFSQEEKEISRSVGGLGLGLSIAKENTELLGGTITLKSEKNKGSIFFVTIPYKPIYPQKNNSNKNKQHTILIAEDEEVNFLYISTLLENIAPSSITLHAKNGQEAINICKETKQIDIILMDIKMPIMNGHDATKKIKEFRPNLPIIAQTAYTTALEKEKAFSFGCNDFISKPITEKALNQVIKKYLIIE